MIKDQLISIVNQLKRYSANLEVSNMLKHRNWTLIDDSSDTQRLIFDNDNKLVFSINGNVTYGSWQYMPEIKSLIIDRGLTFNAIMCSEVFIDNGILILKKDDNDNNFFVLADTNVIPDLNIYKYLTLVRRQKLNIIERKLYDGRKLELIDTNRKDEKYLLLGRDVSINSNNVPDGEYIAEQQDVVYKIKQNKLVALISIMSYKNPEGINIKIYQKNRFLISKGDLVFINNNRVYNQVIKLNFWNKIVIVNGQVEKLSSRYLIIRKFNEFFDLE